VNGVTEQVPKTSVYRSKNLYDFRVDDDQYFVRTLAVSVPEAVVHRGLAA